MRRWIMVPMAPSIMRIRFAAAASSAAQLGFLFIVFYDSILLFAWALASLGVIQLGAVFQAAFAFAFALSTGAGRRPSKWQIA
ncbi:exported protein of unknown function [Candidatus Filomicrobium marinum]|uniref:Uncharacterized protein n=1 Tax=Candidatus Filomicrobium marinum TaxID=1608628 RepID=A0A0D6JJ05_9HYPH|nr:exported protein of unknown function [Candidatus Filomicrobium marinum]CPR21481.1 exported protein of unknown function [Candidatus Filomicrobium marinum]